VLAIAQLTYSRLKPSVEKVPSDPAALYGIIAENPSVLEAIQNVAYGAKVTVDGILCIPIETLRSMGINTEELETMSVSYQELTEAMKAQEFKTALELLGTAQESQTEFTIQRLINALKTINTKNLEPIINSQDNTAKAVKALMGLIPIKHKVKTPQGRTLWALCLVPPLGDANAE
jgi:hypothetical protein